MSFNGENKMTTSKNDVKENRLADIDKDLLNILLKDNTSKKNIIWATDTYSKKGEMYSFNEQMKPKLITGYHGNVIKPRIEKGKREKIFRSRDKAEVFTPSWVCNAQNNLIDNEWFKKKNTFNFEVEKGWETNYNKIEFSPEINKTWKDYVISPRLEITCGEAPYITSRYDTVDGYYIQVEDRIGFLDRKLRVVSENIDNENDWIEWALNAVKASYGYDWQGDNVLLARENLLYTVLEHYEDKFLKQLDAEIIIKFAKIISWNVWQMDGLKFVIPNSCTDELNPQISLLDDNTETVACSGCLKNEIFSHTGIYCKIMDWQKNKTIDFIDLMKR